MKVVAIMVLGVLAGAARAQTTVEFRIVERTGQTVINSGDAVLDLAVQARVTGGPALCGFGFDAIIRGEADTNGVLARDLTSNADGTYAPSIATGATVGLHGLPRQYSYLAALSASFNGVINQSTGTFTNSLSSQEIGLITGSAMGAALLGIPGIDPAGEGNPATWAGYGTGMSPVFQDTAAIPAAAGTGYLAQGQFVDVYRFRYTVTNLAAARTLDITVQNIYASVCQSLQFANGEWGPVPMNLPGPFPIQGLQVPVLASGQCCAASGACAYVSQSLCTGTWTGGATCSPNTCPQTGACCRGATCAAATLAACTGPGNAFAGVGLACNAPGNQTTPCCKADFDQSGALAINDILGYIAAWFASDPSTDSDGDGTLEVTDILAFVQYWFAGCA